MYVSVHESSGETLKMRKLIRVVAHTISDKISCTDTYTLSKISNWSPYIFYASFERKIRLSEIRASKINQDFTETLQVI